VSRSVVSVSSRGRATDTGALPAAQAVVTPIGQLKLNHDGGWLTELFYSNHLIGRQDKELGRVAEYFSNPAAPCDLELLGRMAPSCLLHLLDTRSLNPAGYQVERYDCRATLDAGRNYTGLLLGDYPTAVYRDNLQQQVSTTWTMQVQRFSEVCWAREDGENRRFRRLLVPLLRSRRRHGACYVLSVTRPLPIAGGTAGKKALLTEREIEILTWTAQGKTSGEIAQILGRSVATVNFHLQNAMGKLNVVNKTQAAIKAHQLGYFVN